MTSSLPSLRSLTGYALGSAQLLLSHGVHALGNNEPTCSNPQLSCHNSTVVTNLCCFNAPGGQLLQTQFWDYDPATGPSNAWTLHGLWPDRCDGTYEAYCDPNREYTNITDILESFGQTSLLSYMNTYWKDYQGDDETFWEHEWEKHGTCISTLEPDCYGSSYQPQEEVVDYFQQAVSLYKTLNSYQFLAKYNITPSTTRKYSLTAVSSALKAGHGQEVTLQCDDNGAINEIWYHYNVRGSLQSGDFVPAPPDGSKGDCPSTVAYIPKGSTGSPTATTTAPGTSPTAPGSPFEGQGYLNVVVNGKKNGCIISGGTWYTTGTCATFTATSSGSGFTLKSSKGSCSVSSSGALSCGSGSGTVFGSDGDESLTYNGSNSFHANSVPTGSTQATVYTGHGGVDIELVWQSR